MPRPSADRLISWNSFPHRVGGLHSNMPQTDARFFKEVGAKLIREADSFSEAGGNPSLPEVCPWPLVRPSQVILTLNHRSNRWSKTWLRRSPSCVGESMHTSLVFIVSIPRYSQEWLPTSSTTISSKRPTCLIFGEPPSSPPHVSGRISAFSLRTKLSRSSNGPSQPRSPSSWTSPSAPVTPLRLAFWTDTRQGSRLSTLLVSNPLSICYCPPCRP